MAQKKIKKRKKKIKKTKKMKTINKTKSQPQSLLKLT